MIFNQYSFVWIAVPVVAVVGYAVWRMRRSPRWLRAALVVVLVAALGALWLVLHPTGTTGISTLADAQHLIADGKPTVIEFFSEY